MSAGLIGGLPGPRFLGDVLSVIRLYAAIPAQSSTPYS